MQGPRLSAASGLAALFLLCSAPCLAQTEAGGQVRLQWTGQQVNALPNRLVALPASSATLENELRATGHGLSGIVTLQQQRQESGASDSRAWVNELYASHDGGAWQFSAGKKIVAWDVGYGYRPNDMVQQEERRALVSSTLEGRPLLMAEHFSADTAWSWIWVNPTQSVQALGAQEPALAARVYRRDGAVDWHGFAHVGTHTGASVGAAVAWVASEALELHSSLRFSERVDDMAIAPTARTEHDVKQLLLGGTWTDTNQLSLQAEAWSDAQALRNVFLRLSWQHDAWQPALDVLYMPADQGRVVTASLIWQGDRVQLQGGLRAYGGPANAVMMLQPVRSLAYAATTWMF